MTIIDTNDHSPQFDDLPYEFSVVESNEVDQLVGHITATDQDSGSNAELQYIITAGMNICAIATVQSDFILNHNPCIVV